MNTFFKLQIVQDGTYLQVNDVNAGGKVLSVDAVIHYFGLIHMEDYDRTELEQKLKGAEPTKMIKLTNKQISPVNECLDVRVSATEEQAVVTFYAPSNGGKTLTKDEIIDALHHSRVKYGIDEQLIEKWVLNRVYNKEILIAQATSPVQGKNGRVIYCFNTNAMAQPRINENGTVDYHQLDNIVHIEAGERLAYLEPAVKGKMGRLVTGVQISPGKIKTPKFKFGRNISLAKDGLSIYSEVSGHAYLVEDKVFVGNTYEVLTDVDASTGDIEYDGDIHVKGNVSSGYSLKATGQIFVEGVVEGARLYAEGPIIIKGGIQGMTKAEIVSLSNVTAKFIENATVNAGGDILAEAIMHSHVTASGNVTVEGKKGLVLGGSVHAKQSVKLKVAGSPMSALTTIEVGIDPMVIKEYRKIEEESRKKEAEFRQLSQILSTYREKLTAGLKLNPNQVVTIKQVAERAKELEQELPKLLEYREELGEELLKCNDGKVIVEDKVYPSVKIVIASAVLIVKKETHYCTFIKDDIDVKAVSL